MLAPVSHQSDSSSFLLALLWTPENSVSKQELIPTHQTLFSWMTWVSIQKKSERTWSSKCIYARKFNNPWGDKSNHAVPTNASASEGRRKNLLTCKLIQDQNLHHLQNLHLKVHCGIATATGKGKANIEAVGVYTIHQLKSLTITMTIFCQIRRSTSMLQGQQVPTLSSAIFPTNDLKILNHQESRSAHEQEITTWK